MSSDSAYCVGVKERSTTYVCRHLHQTARTRPATLSQRVLTYRAVQNGATTLAEAFLFFVGAGLVLGESFRSSRKEGKRRDDVKERIETLEEEIETLRGALGEEGNLDAAIRDLRDQYGIIGSTAWKLMPEINDSSLCWKQ